MDEDAGYIRIGGGTAPERPLDVALAAYAAEESARAWRAVLVGALAACSAPLWLSAVWPAWLAPRARAAVDALWALAAAAVLVAFARERWARRRRSASVAALGSARK